MNICLYDFEVKGILNGVITELWRPCKIPPPGEGYQISRLMDSTAKEDRRNIDKLRWINIESLTTLVKDDRYFNCPFGSIGTRIIGKETWFEHNGSLHHKANYSKNDLKGYSDFSCTVKWHSSAIMPLEFSRITLINTGVECKLVNKITYAEMKAAGFKAVEEFDGCFAEVWNRYNPKYPFESAYGWKLKFESEVKR